MQATSIERRASHAANSRRPRRSVLPGFAASAAITGTVIVCLVLFPLAVLVFRAEIGRAHV